MKQGQKRNPLVVGCSAIAIVLVIAVASPCIGLNCNGPRRDINRAVTVRDAQGQPLEFSIRFAERLFQLGFNKAGTYYVRVNGEDHFLLDSSQGSESHLGCVRVAPGEQQLLFEASGHGVASAGLLYDVPRGTFREYIIDLKSDPTDAWERRCWSSGREARPVGTTSATTSPTP